MRIFDSNRKRSGLGLLLALAMLLSLLPAVTVSAAQTVPDTVAVAQSQNGTCTLASAAMMIRARMYLSGNNKWRSITEEDIRGDVWLEGAGIYFSWTYTTVGVVITGDHEDVSGISADRLASLLKRHPEGIELYCAGVPHAVCVIDYSDGVFYCFDPAQHYSGKRIPLTDSWLGENLGSQSSILAAVTSFWYISSYSIQPNTAIPTAAPTTEPTVAPTTEPTDVPSAAPAEALRVTRQPVNQIGQAGERVAFLAEAAGAGALTYQWEYSRDGQSWQRSSAEGTKAICLLNQTTTGTWYRCRITDAAGQCVYTRAAQLLLDEPPVITRQPEDAYGSKGSAAGFSIAAEGDGLTYQWQLSVNNGKKWINSQSTEDHVDFNIDETRNGRIYRCVVTNAAGLQTISRTARIVLTESMKITRQPTDCGAVDGAKAYFVTTAEGIGLHYQWEYSADDGKSWKQTETDGHYLVWAAKAEHDGWLFRCVITDRDGAKLTTNTAALTVATLKFTAEPENVTASRLQAVRFRVGATGEDLHYQWQISTDGKVWYNAATSQSLIWITTPAANGRLIRCVVIDGYGNYIISRTAKLTVQ